MVLPLYSVGRHFRMLKDPRRKHCRRHLLLSIVVIALCAVIANCDDWQKVEVFARERREWLATFLDLPNGTPSHDTFERLFDRLDPDVLQRCLLGWIQAISGELEIDHIAIDGKTLCHSGSPTRGLGALHLVSAWATTHGLSLGQVAVDGKSNEITAIPRLLELLTVKGALVTIDAMGCQKEIAGAIIAAKGDYVLALKANPDAAVVFAFDERSLRREPWAFHRLAFVFDGVVEMMRALPNPVKLVTVGDPATDLAAVAKQVGAATVHVSDHANPSVRETAATLRRSLTVADYPRPVLAEYTEEPRRFSRYWDKCAPQVLGHAPKGKKSRQ